MTPAKTARKTTSRKTSGGSKAGRSTTKKAAKRTKPKAAAKGSGRKKGGKAKAASKKAAAKSSKRRLSPKARLAEVIERLDRSFGALHLPETHSVLEKAVYLVLREKGSAHGTSRALKSLREDFVDWNEVRVSRAAELSRLLTGTSKGTSLRRFEERANRVRELIDQIYNDRNEPSLEFLLDEKPAGQLEYLEDLDDLGLHNAYALVQWLAGDERLTLVSAEMAQASRKLGLTDSAAVTKVRKELSALAADSTLLVTVQAHLNQLGELEDSDWPSSLKELLA